MSMAVGGSGGPKADINMTPMIDVLLVLIIIFMVITPLTPKGLEALVPQPPPPNQPPTPDDRTIVVTVNADKTMLINTEPTDINKLGPRLADIFKTRADHTMFVKGDPSLEYGSVAEVIDVAHGVGIDKVGLMPFKDLQ